MFANATDMCARDNVMVLVFDPQVIATGSGMNTAEWSWWVQFPYGRITGEATCLSETEGLGRKSGMGSYYGTGDYSSTFISAASGLSGVDTDGAPRSYCWCKMTHPAVSHWVFDEGIGSNCASVCTSYCANHLRSAHYPNFKKGLFESIGR